MHTQQSVVDSRFRLRIALAALALAACYGSVLVSLAEGWSNSALYSFGFAVPLISAYLIWMQGSELKALQIESDTLIGTLLVAASCLMAIAGQIGSLITIQGLAIVVALAGFALLFFGRRVFSRIWFPLVYLAISVPFWGYLVELLQLPSRLFSAQLASVILHVAGVPALTEGTHIVLPNVTLEVLRECSGVNQLITFAAMALPAAYLFLRGPIRRTALVLSGVAISYFTNGVRIALVGWLAYRGLGDGKVASLHLLEGLAVSALGYIAFGACLSLLARTEPNGPTPRPVDLAHGNAAALSPVRHEGLELGLISLVFVVAIGRIWLTPVDVHLSTPLNALPTHIAGWRMDDTRDQRVRFPAIDDAFVSAYPTESGVRRFEGLDEEMVRSYRGPGGARVRLYVGYLRSQHEGKELAGQASQDLSRVASVVTVPTAVGDVQVSGVEKTGLDGRGLLYWYDLNGRIARDTFQAKRLTLEDAFTRRRTNAAVVMVGWECSSPTICQSERSQVLSFVGALVPVLRGQLPS